MTLLADLIPSKTAAQLREAVLSRLSGLGFPVTSWASGGVARTLVEGFAFIVADARAAMMLVAKGGYLDTAEGPWLDLLARSVFDEARQPAVFTEGKFRVACAMGSGPYTLAAGAFIAGVQAVGSTPARRYVSTETVTVNPDSAATVHVKAEETGSRFNIGSGLELFVFTPLPGVTVTNPVYASGTWITTSGVEAETDARLRQRCRDKWATVAYGATRAAYAYWIATASAEATKVYFGAPPGNGVVPIWIAGDAAVVSGPALSAVRAAVATVKPITDAPAIEHATPQAVAVSGTVYVRNNAMDAAEAAADVAREALQRRLQIGEGVDLGALYQVLRAHVDVVDADITVPSGDVAAAAPAFAVLDLSGVVWVAAT